MTTAKLLLLTRLDGALDRPPPRGSGVFNDMLKKSCPYHKTPVNHTLE
jgi:hypothetical protein